MRSSLHGYVQHMDHAQALRKWPWFKLCVAKAAAESDQGDVLPLGRISGVDEDLVMHHIAKFVHAEQLLAVIMEQGRIEIARQVLTFEEHGRHGYVQHMDHRWRSLGHKGGSFIMAQIEAAAGFSALITREAVQRYATLADAASALGLDLTSVQVTSQLAPGCSSKSHVTSNLTDRSLVALSDDAVKSNWSTNVSASRLSQAFLKEESSMIARIQYYPGGGCCSSGGGRTLIKPDRPS